MKLVQFWKDNAPALGLMTEGGIVDVAAEGARRWLAVPATMEEAIAQGAEGLEALAKLEQGAQCFTTAPLAPVVTNSSKILCIGLNYRQHAKECSLPLPPAPVLFNKFSTALAAHGDCIKLPGEYKEYDYEAELVAVMGKLARNVSPEEALDYVYGYTCGNDRPPGTFSSPGAISGCCPSLWMALARWAPVWSPPENWTPRTWPSPPPSTENSARTPTPAT